MEVQIVRAATPCRPVRGRRNMLPQPSWSTPKMEAAYSPRRLTLTQKTTQCHIQEITIWPITDVKTSKLTQTKKKVFGQHVCLLILCIWPYSYM
jgi:hypothetical protein